MGLTQSGAPSGGRCVLTYIRDLVTFVTFQARRSMVFSQKLRDVADQFREAELNSDDLKDNTVLEDWPEMKVCS